MNISKLNQDLAVEKMWNERLKASVEQYRKDIRTKSLIKTVAQISASDNIKNLIEAEKTILKFEFKHYSNSSSMDKSLFNALQGMDVVLEQINILSDHNRYAESARNYTLPKNQKAGLPFDQARQVFDSHLTRLRSLDKARLSELEKEVIEARINMWRNAQGLYINMQKECVAKMGISDNSEDKFKELIQRRDASRLLAGNETPAVVNKNSQAYKRLMGNSDDNQRVLNNVGKKPKMSN